MEVELELSRKIAFQATTDRAGFLRKIRELKGILRTPRLYHIYKEQFNQFQQLDEQVQYEVGKYKRNYGVVDEADAKSKGGEGTRSVVLSTYRSPDGKITARSQS